MIERQVLESLVRKGFVQKKLAKDYAQAYVNANKPRAGEI